MPLTALGPESPLPLPREGIETIILICETPNFLGCLLYHFPERGLKHLLVSNLPAQLRTSPLPLPREGIETVASAAMLKMLDKCLLYHFPERGLKQNIPISAYLF